MSYIKLLFLFPLYPTFKEGVFILFLIKNFVFSEKEYKIKA